MSIFASHCCIFFCCIQILLYYHNFFHHGMNLSSLICISASVHSSGRELLIQIIQYLHQSVYIYYSTVLRVSFLFYCILGKSGWGQPKKSHAPCTYSPQPHQKKSCMKLWYCSIVPQFIVCYRACYLPIRIVDQFKMISG